MLHPPLRLSIAVLAASLILSFSAWNLLRKKKKTSSQAPCLSSSLSSFSWTGTNYHVFLSFCGADTRKGFTDHLFRRLVNVGTAFLFVFRDEESLPIGEEIGQQLHDAIVRSKICIPILSENYASSEWCLMELAEMMEQKGSSGHIVLPIFYKVKPSEVRHQKGNFGKAFRSLRKKFDSEVLEKWKKLLVDVCTLKGWESEKFADGYEGKLIDEVVETVLIELSKDFQLMVPEYLVGIDDHVVEMMRMLDTYRVIGVYGMSGVGKTTVAKLVYNNLSTRFRYRSFIADIRESIESKTKRIEHLQSQLIHDLLDRKSEVPNVDVGTNILRFGLKEKNVLILLDDVDNESQLVALFGEYNRYSTGSKIIITTKNYDVLKSANFSKGFQYELSPLRGAQSLLLFSRYTFSCDSPPHKFDEVSRRVVTTAGGLPLALRVIGSLLHGEEDLEVWKETFRRLSNVPIDEVTTKLRLSYERLNYETQQIFLDIACFFTGIDIRIPTYMWESCEFYPKRAIIALKQRSLIGIGDNNEIQMHNQLRALGRQIVREENYGEPKNRSRLWGQEALKVLQGMEGNEKIRYIHLYDRGLLYKGPQQKLPTCRVEQFKELKNLRMFQAGSANLAGDFKNLLLELRWLQCNIDMSPEVTNFYMEKLVILELSGNLISERWIGWSSMKMERLKVLKLSSCMNLRSTPILCCENLEVLKLEDCHHLERVSLCTGCLQKLTSLEMRNCHSLGELPEELGSLTKLEQIIAMQCNSVARIPDSIGRLYNLSTIKFFACSWLVKVPDSIGKLTRLKRLNMAFCELREIPYSIGKLTSLVELNLQGTKIRELPESIGDLQNLKELNLERSTIEKLPESIGRLGRLQELIASHCSYLKGEIPSGVGELSSLMILQLCKTDISALPETIYKLSSLQHLDIEGCDKLQSLPELPSTLTSFELTCQSPTLPQVSQLIHLKDLTLQDCSSLERLPELSSKLSRLVVNKCNKLKKLPDLSNLKLLIELNLHNCSKLTEVIGLEGLESLTRLNVSGCTTLSEIHGLNRLKYLESLDISGCNSIKSLDLLELTSLRTLYASGCEELVEIQGLDSLEFLEMLNISRCKTIDRLPNLSCFNTLKQLNINNCVNLRDIECLERFSSCQWLYIDGCKSLAKLPNLSMFENLIELTVKDCIELVEVPELRELRYLEYMDFSRCKTIEYLPDLSECRNLKCLVVRDCEKLTKLTGIEDLESLWQVDISGCKSLKAIPQLPWAHIIQNYEDPMHSPLYDQITFGQ